MNIDNTQDIIDVRDIIEYVEENESLAATLEDDEAEEYSQIRQLLNDLRGNGGDEQWRGDWYPLTLIHEDYFQEYAQELAEDLGYKMSEQSWPLTHIDWEAAAEALLMDYTSVEFDGVTYWYR